MDEQTQEQFIQWLAQQLGVQSEQELEAAIEEMGEEGLQQAMQAFMQEMQGGGGGGAPAGGQQPVAAMLQGGKLDYIQSLNSFKKGGKIKDDGKDGKTALGKTKWNNKKDSKSAKSSDNRKEPKKQWISAKTK